MNILHLGVERPKDFNRGKGGLGKYVFILLLGDLLLSAWVILLTLVETCGEDDDLQSGKWTDAKGLGLGAKTFRG